MAQEAYPAGAEFLKEVERLAGEGKGKGEIARVMGFRNTSTFSNRLVRVSQETGKPIPVFSRGGGRGRREAAAVEVKRRGRGTAFGVYVPQEPLERLGVQPGDRLRVRVGRRRIVLERPGEGPPEPRAPRLVKRNREQPAQE